MDIAPQQIKEFPLQSFCAQLLFFPTLPSTNLFLKQYAQKTQSEGEKLSSGICAIAHEQTAGYGRMGRSWHSAAGTGFYFSLLLTPKLDAYYAPLLTLMVAIATAETIMVMDKIHLDIKWPNDILLNEQKVAGILAEAVFEGAALNYAIIGIGVNLQHKYFPAEIQPRPTSLYLATGKTISVEEFLYPLLLKLDQWYGLLLNEPAKIVARWQELSSFAQGKRLRVKVAEQELEVSTYGLTPNGALQGRKANGEILTFYGEEVTVIKEGA